MKAIVTVKLPKNLHHDPNQKMIGECPVNARKLCTDVTGEHHSLVAEGTDIPSLRFMMETQGYHVTRIEVIE